MKVFDERDTEMGSRMILQRTSAKPYRDGMHYFRALEWRQVGAYRITFKLALNSKARCAVALAPLSYCITVSDPEWERGMYDLLASEAEAAVEQEMRDQARRAGFAFAPLSDRERCVGAMLYGSGGPVVVPVCPCQGLGGHSTLNANKKTVPPLIPCYLDMCAVLDV